MMAEQDFIQDLGRFTRSITLKTLFETSELVATNTKSIVQIDPFAKLEQSYKCKVSYRVMDAFSQRPFYVVVANASMSVFKLPKNQRVATRSPPPSRKLYIRNDKYSPYQPSSSTASSVNVTYWNQTTDHSQQTKRDETVKQTWEDPLDNIWHDEETINNS